MVLETNCIKQLEGKQAQIILIIILQILTAEQTFARETHAIITGKSIPMIVNEMIWAECLAGCLMQLVSNTKVNLSQPLSPQPVCNQG